MRLRRHLWMTPRASAPRHGARHGQAAICYSSFAEARGEWATFAAFPVAFDGEDAPRFWAEDGIHLSAAGYRELGRRLAPAVLEAFVRWGAFSHADDEIDGGIEPAYS